MSGIGAAGFVEGLQGGIAARDSMDRNKQFKQMRKLRISEGELDLEGRRDEAQVNQEELLGKDFSQEDFDEEWGAFKQDKDPALLRLGKWMGGKLKGAFSSGGKGEEGGAAEAMGIATPSVQPAGLQASGVQTFAAPGFGAEEAAVPARTGFADGGSVEEERLKRSYGDNYLTEEEAANADPYVFRGRGGRTASAPRQAGRQAIPTSGGGLAEFGSDLARSASGFFENTRRSALAGDEDVQESFDKMRNAENANEAGAGFTDWAVDSARAGLATGVGILDDTVGKVARPVGSFLAGMAGFDGEPKQPTDTPTTPEGAAIGASVDNPDVPAEQLAQGAIGAAKEEVIENFDYKLLVDQGVRPEELPSMSTKDWSQYRARMTMAMAKQGMGVVDAHKQVDERITNMQMTGFAREGNKAMLYLQSGQAREAAMALRQAYQYFPNGVTVKFGTMPDPKTGQPVIVTIATDEDTGEPTGKPMIITTERLSVMMENMQKPEAFRTWTKDGHDLQIKINQLQSIDDYRQGSLDINAYEAETDRAEGLAGGGRNAMTDSEIRQRSELYMDVVKEAGLMEGIPGLDEGGNIRALYDAMAQYEKVSGIREPATVARRVIEAFTLDPDNGVQELLATARGQ